VLDLVVVHDIVLIGDITNEFFDQVFHGDDARRAAVFITHDRQMG